MGDTMREDAYDNLKRNNMAEEKKWMGSEPIHCDLCGEAFTQVFIDGKTMQGPWGLLCSVCHEVYGVGLGTGRGQMYSLVTKIKIGG